MSQLKINDLYKATLDRINAEERGQFTIDRFNRYANDAIRDFIDYLTGRLSEEPTPRLEVFKKQKLVDLMFPVVVREMVTYANGLIPYPTAYDHLLDLRLSGSANWKPGNCKDLPAHTLRQILNGQAGFQQVDVLSHERVASRVNTHIKRLKAKPCAEQFDDGFLIHNAKEGGSVFFVYLKEVEKVKYNAVMNNDKKIMEYSEAGSVHPPFHEKVGPFLARKIADFHFAWVREHEAIQATEAAAKAE